MIVLLGLAAFAATLMGGLFALKYKDRLHLITGFSAGAIIGVAFFELMHESSHLLGVEGAAYASALAGLGFAIYLVMNRLVLSHSHEHESMCTERGALGAGSLIAHSFIDGVAIGLAFQVSSTVGWAVTVAVLAHDFSDGINTVSIILRNGNNHKRAIRWLIGDAAAPLLGVILTQFIIIPSSILGIILGLMCGFFLYIGASDLLPESHHAHPRRMTTAMTLAGMGVMYIIISISG